MKTHRILCLMLLAWAVASLTAWADEPFRKHRYDAFRMTPPPEGSIIMLGNSITDMHPWVEAFRTASDRPLPIVNRGNSGTVAPEQLANLENYLVHSPAKVFVMIGTNDIATNGLNATPEQVLTQVQAIASRIHLRSPKTKVYLQPVLNNKTGNRSAERWLRINEMLKAYVRETGASWLSFVDIYDTLTDIASGGVWSFDGLHLTAASYRKWCEALLPYMQEGLDEKVFTVYPAEAVSLQQDGGIGRNSNGMRATYVSLLPITKDDILFFGDEEVKCGEWNELLGTPFVKNRGTGWGWGGTIALTSKMADATFATVSGVEKATPRAILLYTGTSDVHGSTEMATVQANYLALVNKLKALAPGARLYLVGLHPVGNATTNAQHIAPFNAYLRSLAGGQVSYIDLCTDMTADDGTALTTCVPAGQNYLYGTGYARMARVIAEALKADFPTLSLHTPSDGDGALR